MSRQLRPLGIGEILDVGIKIYWRNVRTLLTLVFVVVAAVRDPLALWSRPRRSPTATIPDRRRRPPRRSTSTGSSGSGSPPFRRRRLCCSFLAGIVATGACFRAIARRLPRRADRVAPSLAYAARRFHSILWVTILGTFIAVLGFFFLHRPGRLPLGQLRGRGPGAADRGVKGTEGARPLAPARQGPLVAGRSPSSSSALILVVIVERRARRAHGDRDVARHRLDPTLGSFIFSTIATVLASVITTPLSAAFIDRPLLRPARSQGGVRPAAAGATRSASSRGEGASPGDPLRGTGAAARGAGCGRPAAVLAAAARAGSRAASEKPNSRKKSDSACSRPGRGCPDHSARRGRHERDPRRGARARPPCRERPRGARAAAAGRPCRRSVRRSPGSARRGARRTSSIAASRALAAGGAASEPLLCLPRRAPRPPLILAERRFSEHAAAAPLPPPAQLDRRQLHRSGQLTWLSEHDSPAARRRSGVILGALVMAGAAVVASMLGTRRRRRCRRAERAVAATSAGPTRASSNARPTRPSAPGRPRAGAPAAVPRRAAAARTDRSRSRSPRRSRAGELVRLLGSEHFGELARDLDEVVYGGRPLRAPRHRACAQPAGRRCSPGRARS